MNVMLAPDYSEKTPYVVTVRDPLVGKPANLDDDRFMATDDVYSPKSLGPKYPAHAMDAPVLSGLDAPGLLAAAVMTLGPLAAYAAGFGL